VKPPTHGHDHFGLGAALSDQLGRYLAQPLDFGPAQVEEFQISRRISRLGFVIDLCSIGSAFEAGLVTKEVRAHVDQGGEDEKHRNGKGTRIHETLFTTPITWQQRLEPVRNAV
jgi:hypothetical protein